MTRLYTGRVYTNKYEVLATPDHYVAMGFDHPRAVIGDLGLAVLDDGRFVVKAGTIFPSNDADAVGVVLNDVDVTDRDATLAVVVHGHIKTAALPKVPTADAKSAMKLIKFLPMTSQGAYMSVNSVTEMPYGFDDYPYPVPLVSIHGAKWRFPECLDIANWTVHYEGVLNDIPHVVLEMYLQPDGTLEPELDHTGVVDFHGGFVTVKPSPICLSTGQDVEPVVILRYLP